MTTIQELADLILAQTQERLRTAYPNSPQWEWETVQVKQGPVYTKIDRGPAANMSGMLMIENATGAIYGIKGYGRVHKGHFYGTLDTVADWYWGNYYPERRTVRSSPREADWYASAVIGRDVDGGTETEEMDGYFRGARPKRSDLGVPVGWKILAFNTMRTSEL
jgi:hypothetical protein